MATIQAIYRYSVKGLAAEPLVRTSLTSVVTVPGESALCHRERPIRFRSDNAFLLSQTALPDADAQRTPARLRSAFDQSSHMLSIRYEGREAVFADLMTQFCFAVPIINVSESSAAKEFRRHPLSI